MTFVGKILVIVIMVFALFFLALSTVVFTTAKNWKDETARLKTEIQKFQGQVSELNGQVEQRKQELTKAQAEHQQQVQMLEGRIDQLTQENQVKQNELTQQRTELATATETARQALAEASARKGETDLLRQQLAEVQDLANKYQLQQTSLYDQIRVLKRELETAQGNNKDLRERVALLAGVIRSKGLSTDIQQIKAVGVPPKVEGEVQRVSENNQRVEITIGSDDGVVVGHEFDIWRTEPNPDYIGRIRIESVDPDQAVGRVIGKTVQGKKIQEGDRVTPEIPRS